MGLGDGSVGKILSAQAGGSEFRSPAPTQMPTNMVASCSPSAYGDRDRNRAG